jgi:hypothetical protein
VANQFFFEIWHHFISEKWEYCDKNSLSFIFFVFRWNFAPKKLRSIPKKNYPFIDDNNKIFFLKWELQDDNNDMNMHACMHEFEDCIHWHIIILCPNTKSFPSKVSCNFTRRKALPGFFLCIFSSLTCLKKPVFSKRDLLLWKVPTRLVEGTQSHPLMFHPHFLLCAGDSRSAS